MTGLEGFSWGLMGGLFAELLGWFKLRQRASSEFPWLRSVFYWLVTFAMVLAGGILVLAYIKTGASLYPMLAINIGASAPLIMAELAAQAPKPDLRID